MLERLLSSRTKGELLQLYHRQPGLVDTSEGVARQIGRSPAEVEEAIGDFVQMGILRRGSEGALQVLKYDMIRDREVQGMIEAYFRSLAK